MIGKILLMGILTLSLLGLTGCLQKPVIVLNEARTVKLQEGQAAPWSGWLLTDGAMEVLLDEVERCQNK